MTIPSAPTRRMDIFPVRRCIDDSLPHGDDAVLGAFAVRLFSIVDEVSGSSKMGACRHEVISIVLDRAPHVAFQRPDRNPLTHAERT
jgi:hypothetical protein